MEYPQHKEELRNRRISLLLKLGVYGSAFLLVCGLVTALLGGSVGLTGESRLTIDDVLAALVHPSSASSLPTPILLLSLGLLFLMFTPIVRVIAALVSFLTEKDWTFSLVSLIVLSVLILEIVLSLG